MFSPLLRKLPPPPRIQSVKFPSRWRSKYDLEGTGIAEFKLGPGPCGLTVTRIFAWWSANGSLFTVRQHCADGYEFKDFTYRASDITGRVEIEYAG